ncbi:MAG: thioredoxin, partial [Acidimicrobiia bacterium]
EESRRRPVVVDFWAEWCGPCKVLGPMLERLAAEGAGSWLLAKVDVDQNQALAQQFGVQGIPTVVAFRDGQVVNQFTGALGEPQVRSFLQSIVPTELDMAAAAAEAAYDEGDVAGAEAGFGAVLEQDPAHEIAGLGLATILLDRNDAAAALEVLARLPRSEDVRRMESAGRLWGDAGDVESLAEAAAASGAPGDRLAYAKALSVNGDAADAMEILVDLVSERGELAEEARVALLDLFEVLGHDHALVGTYRRRLASALF